MQVMTGVESYPFKRFLAEKARNNFGLLFLLFFFCLTGSPSLSVKV